MSANHSLAFPAGSLLSDEAMADAQPWVSEEERMLPARQVLFASLGLIAVALTVLLAS